jgi:hypothetical protein
LIENADLFKRLFVIFDDWSVFSKNREEFFAGSSRHTVELREFIEGLDLPLEDNNVGFYHLSGVYIKKELRNEPGLIRHPVSI